MPTYYLTIFSFPIAICRAKLTMIGIETYQQQRPFVELFIDGRPQANLSQIATDM
jgi:hypothetical protein